MVKIADFGSDQAIHSNAPSRRKLPLEIALSEIHRQCAHGLLVPPIGIFRMLQVPERPAASHGGGGAGTELLAGAELYDRSRGTFSATVNMSSPWPTRPPCLQTAEC